MTKKKVTPKKKRMTQSERRDQAWNVVEELNTAIMNLDADLYKEIQWNEDSTVRADLDDFLDLNEDFFEQIRKIQEKIILIRVIKNVLRS